MWNDPDDPVDNLTGPERRRFITVWAIFAVGIGVPVALLMSRLTGDSIWDSWLDGAAIGLASGLAVVIAVKDLGRRRPD